VVYACACMGGNSKWFVLRGPISQSTAVPEAPSSSARPPPEQAIHRCGCIQSPLRRLPAAHGLASPSLPYQSPLFPLHFPRVPFPLHFQESPSPPHFPESPLPYNVRVPPPLHCPESPLPNISQSSLFFYISQSPPLPTPSH